MGGPTGAANTQRHIPLWGYINNVRRRVNDDVPLSCHTLIKNVHRSSLASTKSSGSTHEIKYPIADTIEPSDCATIVLKLLTPVYEVLPKSTCTRNSVPSKNESKHDAQIQSMSFDRIRDRLTGDSHSQRWETSYPVHSAVYTRYKRQNEQNLHGEWFAEKGRDTTKWCLCGMVGRQEDTRRIS